MSVLFYGSAIIAILATLLVITRTNIVHACCILLFPCWQLLSFFTLWAHLLPRHLR